MDKDHMPIHPLWWRRSRNSVSVPVIGREQREQDRIRKAQQLTQELLSIVAEEIPELIQGQVPAGLHAADLERVLTRIAASASSPHQRRTLHNYFCTALDRGNRAGVWSLPIPAPFLTLKRESPLRDLAFFRRASAFKTLKVDFERTLASLSQREQQWHQEGGHTLLQARRAALVLFAAAAYGGLCNPLRLSLLFHALQTSGLGAFRPDLLWADLSFPSAEHAANVPGSPQTLQRWYLDPASQLLLGYYHRHYGLSTPTPPPADPDKGKRWTFDLLAPLLRSLDSHPDLISLDEFCQAAIGALERHPRVDLPSYLTHYALGIHPSYSLPPNRLARWFHWAPVNGPTPEAPPPPEATATVPAPPLDRTQPQQPSVNTVTSSQQATALLRCVYGSRGASRKAPTAIQHLQSFRQHAAQQGSVIGQLLAQWAIQLLTAGSRWQHRALAPSTVYESYLILVSKNLLGLCANDDPLDFDAAEFEALYSDTLAHSPRVAKARTVSALAAFHEFLMRCYQVPDIDPSVLTGGPRTPVRVRALVVSESEFAQARQWIAQDSNLPVHWKTALDWALLLGFRAGLRLGEVMKLRLQDLFIAQGVTLSIRSNRYGSNKTSCSLRRLDLALLLPEDEFLPLKMEWQRLQILHQPVPQALLISDDSNRLQPLDHTVVRATLHQALRRATGESTVVFHSLRHSALNRLLLAIEAPDWAARLCTPNAPAWSVSTAALTGSHGESSKRLWALAAIAGHSSPAITLQSYVHCLDLLCYDRVRHGAPELTSRTLAWLLNTSPQAIHHQAQHHRQQEPIPIAPFTPRAHAALQTVITDYRPLTTTLIEFKPVEPHLLSLHQLEPQHYAAILQHYEAGMAVADIAWLTQIASAAIHQVITAGQAVVAVATTRRQRSRLIHPQRRQTQGHSAITPALPPERQDRHEAEAMWQRLYQSWRIQPDEVRWGVDYFLAHAFAYGGGIRFRSPADALRMVELLKFLVDNTQRLVAQHRPSSASSSTPEQQRAHWGTQLPGLSISSSKKAPITRSGFPWGQLILSVLHPHPPQHRLQSAHSFKYAFHGMAILLMSQDLQTATSTTSAGERVAAVTEPTTVDG